MVGVVTQCLIILYIFYIYMCVCKSLLMLYLLTVIQISEGKTNNLPNVKQEILLDCLILIEMFRMNFTILCMVAL